MKTEDFLFCLLHASRPNGDNLSSSETKSISINKTNAHSYRLAWVLFRIKRLH